MKGFDGWIEIFKGGRQVDSRGVEHDGNAIIEKAVATFDAGKHEPPVVVGHPVDNSPAFGWVKELSATVKNGANVLLARLDVAPGFADLVKRGVYKKRSAAFYPDGRLRHVGFLGGMPPAVKGLADIGFNGSEETTCFEFSNNQTAPAGAPKEGAMTFKEFVEAMKFWKQVQEDPDTPFPEIVKGKTFSEADMAAALEAAKKEAADKAREEARKQAAAEFSETQAKAAKEARAREIKAFIEAGVKNGAIAPAWKEGGLQEFMEGLDAGTEIEFSEGRKQSPSAWFQTFLEGLPKLIDFGEVATRGKDVGAGHDDAKLVALAKSRAKEAGCTFTEALVQVSKENPGLAG